MAIQLTDDFDFAYSAESKNISVLKGVTNLSQNIKILMNTFVGENKLYPTFGTRLQDLLGHNPSPNFVRYILKTAILSDPRYKEVTNMTVVRQPNKTLVVTATVKLTSSDELITVTGEING